MVVCGGAGVRKAGSIAQRSNLFLRVRLSVCLFFHRDWLREDTQDTEPAYDEFCSQSNSFLFRVISWETRNSVSHRSLR